MNLHLIDKPVRDGKARAFIAAFAMSVASVGALAAPGFYDPTFNSNGISMRDIGPGNDGARAVALQPDGKIVAVGGCSKTAGAGARNWCVTRFTTIGGLDSGFGTGGIVQISGASDQYASGVAIAPDDSIVVTGTCQQQFCAYRLSPSGGVYNNFGSGGAGRAVFTPPGIVVDARSMALQTDGRIIVGGQCYNSALLESICLVRFNADGSVDSSFSNVAGGGVQFGFFSGQIYRLGALAVQSDSKVIYAGSLNIGQYNYVRGRLNTNGSLDGSWQTGVLAPPGTTTNVANSVALQADGKALLGGYCTISSVTRFCVARVLASDGSLDASYGVNGFYVAPVTVLGGGTGVSIIVQPDGKAILSGTWSSNFGALRLNEDGTLDTTWANTGYTYGNINNGDQLYASALQRDGKLVWAGQCTLTGGDQQLCVQRVDGGPYGASGCTPDIDGDGRVLGPTDALILSRVRQGLTGAAAIGGITFGASASRNTWPLIRQYLVAECGLTVKE
ncbi:MAG: hypothetical protein ABIZ64_10850 [Casimicrobium sp.]